MDAKKALDRSGGGHLVILPGLMCDARMFGPQIDAFDATVIDGFYGSADRIPAMAEYALAQMTGAGPCALLGHSMGARVALEVWRQAPDRVSRLCLADTGIHPPRPGERDGRYALRDLGRRDGIAALVDKWLPPMVGARRRADEQLMSLLRQMACGAGLETFERQIEALLNRPELDAVLETVDRPVFAIVGSEDEWAPVSQHQDIVSRIPNAELRIVEGAGHMSPIEEPEKFNALLRDWLKF